MTPCWTAIRTAHSVSCSRPSGRSSPSLSVSFDTTAFLSACATSHRRPSSHCRGCRAYGCLPCPHHVLDGRGVVPGRPRPRGPGLDAGAGQTPLAVVRDDEASGQHGEGKGWLARVFRAVGMTASVSPSVSCVCAGSSTTSAAWTSSATCEPGWRTRGRGRRHDRRLRQTATTAGLMKTPNEITAILLVRTLTSLAQRRVWQASQDGRGWQCSKPQVDGGGAVGEAWSQDKGCMLGEGGL